MTATERIKFSKRIAQLSKLRASAKTAAERRAIGNRIIYMITEVEREKLVNRWPRVE
jgi:hypothetical protein